MGTRDKAAGDDGSLALDRFIDSLELLDAEQLSILDAVWRAVDHGVHQRAWEDVRRLARNPDLGRLIDAARDRALHWANRGSNVPAMPYSLKSEDQWLEARRNAAAALVDAALATTLGDRLPDEARDTLLGPWLRATTLRRG
jgi:hypothetical protein